jgi:hypothetical protein
MHEPYIGTGSSSSGHETWHAIHQALENEICLDKYFRETRTNLQSDERVPNYKLMGQLAIRSRLGFLYRPFIALAQAAIPVIAAVQWLFSLVVVAIRVGHVSDATLHVISKAQINLGMVENAMQTEPSLRKHIVDRNLLSIAKLSRSIGLHGVLFCITANIRLLWHILQTDSSKRTDLLLHSRDAFTLLLLVRFVQYYPNHVFATDSHYQRWAYLLSHYCKDFRIVQHGILGMDIPFTHAFGSAHTVYVRDTTSISAFAAYYQVLESKLHLPVRDFKTNPFSDTGIFLASSFPSIDDEIELLKRIKSQLEIPVIIKFHPAHPYDIRKQELIALASYICSDDEYPNCQFFVSHSSSMEWDYKPRGIPSFGIAQLGGAEVAAKAILDHVAHGNSSYLAQLAGIH